MSLPPYSTYRTDSKQMLYPQATSYGNILTFTPPGFKQELNVKFPDSRLAVCEKCKKNFKTRDMCRVRSTHTSPPWSTAYICITIDDSCTDENGKYHDKPMTVRMVQWQPYCVKKPFGSKTPVCAACKRTNRTRSFCRERHKHRQLPWCTVYVLLSALDATDPATVVAGASKKVDEEGKNGDKAKSEEEDIESFPGPKNEEPDEEEGDDINEIPESRTFLAKVSSRSATIHWLELSDFDSSEQAFTPAPDAQYPGIPQPGMDPNLPPPHAYYPPGYSPQEHHAALKSQQEYFFQLQQQQRQQPTQYGTSPVQRPSWPAMTSFGGSHSQPPTMVAASPGGGSGNGSGDGSNNASQGPSDTAASAGGTAGEAAAQHPHLGAPPHWPMYYGNYAMPPPDAAQPGVQAATSNEDGEEDKSGGDGGVETDEHAQREAKRARI